MLIVVYIHSHGIPTNLLFCPRQRHCSDPDYHWCTKRLMVKDFHLDISFLVRNVYGVVETGHCDASPFSLCLCHLAHCAVFFLASV